MQDFGITGEVENAPSKDDDDDDVDLFGSDDEVDEEAEKAKQARIAAYAEKKSKSKFCFKLYNNKITDFFLKLSFSNDFLLISFSHFQV